jgi:hypothetical protein
MALDPELQQIPGLIYRVGLFGLDKLPTATINCRKLTTLIQAYGPRFTVVVESVISSAGLASVTLYGDLCLCVNGALLADGFANFSRVGGGQQLIPQV